MSYDVDESEEEVSIVELQMAGNKVGLVGLSTSGVVYLSGDLHPMGAFSALLLAAKEHVPYISTSAINALFPVDWIRGACLGDPDRLRVLGNLEQFARRSL
jgi:hypothetical protein